MSGRGNPTGVAMGVTNQQSPSQSFVYSFSLTLVAGTPQQIDLRGLQNINLLKDVQGIYFDNSANTTPCEVTIATGQNITCPGNSQGSAQAYVPPAQPVFTFSGNGTVYIVLTNFSVPSQFWSVLSNTTPVNGSGNVPVQDVLLEDQIINGALSASEALYGNADAIVHGRAGNAYAGTITVPGTTTIITGAPSCFATRIHVTLDPNATGAAIVVSAAFLNAGVIETETALAGVAATAPAGPINIISIDGANLIGTIGGDNLEIITTGSSLTAGSLRYQVLGGTTGLL